MAVAEATRARFLKIFNLFYFGNNYGLLWLRGHWAVNIKISSREAIYVRVGCYVIDRRILGFA